MNELLTQINASLFVPNSLCLQGYQPEQESQDYHACRFEINGRKCLYRVAKITPTKIGQFVTVWKRTAAGPIAPFDESDTIDLAIIQVQDGNLLGQFVFPRSILFDKGIFTSLKKEGKRGIRVYPPWDKPTSNQAIKTQKWQQVYFIDLSEKEPVDQKRIHALYSNM